MTTTDDTRDGSIGALTDELSDDLDQLDPTIQSIINGLMEEIEVLEGDMKDIINRQEEMIDEQERTIQLLKAIIRKQADRIEALRDGGEADV